MSPYRIRRYTNIDHSILSAGSDRCVRVHDVQIEDDFGRVPTIACLERAHNHALSCARWYPFDTGMFTTSSLGRKVRVWDANTMEEAAQFNLEATIYSHALSPIASAHSLIACATSLPDIRLCDLRSGAASHILSGHKSPVLTVEWSPISQYLLVSGSSDKTIKFWDVRQAGKCLVSLDLSNSTVVPRDFNAREEGISHKGPVNSLMFTPDGFGLVSSGLDAHLRCWDVASGRNRLAQFDTSSIRNRHAFPVCMAMTRSSLAPLILHPNDNSSITVLNVRTLANVKVLQGHYGKVTCIIRNPLREEFYSCSKDGTILAWAPAVEERDCGPIVGDDDHVTNDVEDEWSD
eukprot:Partr_v1_DN25885_c1_g3_i2_m2501 putative Excision repair cross-complementing rodent repair deficiency, complementation group 8